MSHVLMSGSENGAVEDPASSTLRSIPAAWQAARVARALGLRAAGLACRLSTHPATNTILCWGFVFLDHAVVCQAFGVLCHMLGEAMAEIASEAPEQGFGVEGFGVGMLPLILTAL